MEIEQNSQQQDDSAAANPVSTEAEDTNQSESDAIKAAIAVMEGKSQDEEPEESKENESEEPDAPSPVQEEKKEEPKPKEEPKEESRLEKSWSALAKADAKLREERKALKEERAQLQKELDEARSLRESIKNDWYKAVQEHAGIAPEDIVEVTAQRYLANGKQTQSEASVKARSEMDEMRAEMKRLREEIQQKEDHRRATEYVSSLDKTLGDDKFELLRTYPQARDEAISYVQKHLENHGELLSPEVALANIQDALVEQIRSLRKAKSWQSLIESGSEPAPQQKNSQKPAAGKTLTNKLGQRTVPVDDDADETDEDERIALAAKMVSWSPR